MNTITALDAWAPPTLRLEPDQLAPGHHGRIMVTIDVPDGCHVQSAQPEEPFLIPTTVELEAPDGVAIGDAVYPTAEYERHEWTPVERSIYRGAVEVVVPVEVAARVHPGVVTIVGRVRYQGCTENTCLPPVEQTVEIKLPIVPPNGPAVPS
jgi:DsbC/DsbD-like thiol-disulfide interchange protein